MASPSLLSSSFRRSLRTVGLDRRISLVGTRVTPLAVISLVVGRSFWATIALRLNASVLTERRVHLAGEEVENTADRRGGGRGVDRAEDQVARLGRVHGRLEGLAVTHFADQDDVGILPHGVLQRRCPQSITSMPTSRWLMRHLSSVNDELDRVFDREDVQPLALVDVVEHRGDRRALARAGDAGQDDHPLVVLTDLGQDRREMEVLEVGDLVVRPRGPPGRAAHLLEQVDAEPGLVVAVEDDVGEVDPPSSSRMPRWRRPSASGYISRSMSSALRAGSCICRRTPASRIAGGEPTLRCRSDPLYFITMRKSLFDSGSLGSHSTAGSIAVDMGSHCLGCNVGLDERGLAGVTGSHLGRAVAALARAHPIGRRWPRSIRRGRVCRPGGKPAAGPARRAVPDIPWFP